jgi:hypothetical protein
MNATVKTQVLCLGAQAYSMPDPRTGEMIEGINLFYAPVTDLTPTDDGRSNYGTQTSKDRMMYEKRHKLVYFPAIYEATMKMESKKGDTKLVITDIDFVSCVEMKMVEPNAQTVPKKDEPKTEANADPNTGADAKKKGA